MAISTHWLTFQRLNEGMKREGNHNALKNKLLPHIALW